MDSRMWGGRRPSPEGGVSVVRTAFCRGVRGIARSKPLCGQALLNSLRSMFLARTNRLMMRCGIEFCRRRGAGANRSEMKTSLPAVVACVGFVCAKVCMWDTMMDLCLSGPVVAKLGGGISC